MIVKGLANFADGTTQCLVRAVAGPPYLAEQHIMSDEAPGHFCKVQEYLDGLGRQVFRT